VFCAGHDGSVIDGRWPDLIFRPAEADLAVVSDWLRAEHVRAWWKDPADLDAVRAKYLPRIRGEEPTEVFIASTSAGAFGLIQRYRMAHYGSWAATAGGATWCSRTLRASTTSSACRE